MGSGPANVQLFLNNHLQDTIAAKREDLKKQVAAVHETMAQLLVLEAHALVANHTPPHEGLHGKVATLVAGPTPDIQDGARPTEPDHR